MMKSYGKKVGGSFDINIKYAVWIGSDIAGGDVE